MNILQNFFLLMALAGILLTVSTFIAPHETFIFVQLVFAQLFWVFG
jgi:hypothetical protein